MHSSKWSHPTKRHSVTDLRVCSPASFWPTRWRAETQPRSVGIGHGTSRKVECTERGPFISELWRIRGEMVRTRGRFWHDSDTNQRPLLLKDPATPRPTSAPDGAQNW